MEKTIIKIESLKDYINSEEFIKLAIKIYELTSFNCSDYPEYKEWYFNKQLPETINTDKRNILFVRNPNNYDEIISMASLKRNEEEKKICTIYVSDKYRGLKIGTAIIEQSMKWLGSNKPLITFPSYKLEMFKPFINKYNWQLIETISELYNQKQELCFNGSLNKKLTKN